MIFQQYADERISESNPDHDAKSLDREIKLD